MKSSIHFCPVKSTSQSHNLRLRDFDYVRKDLKDLNFSFSENQDFQKHSEIIKELKNIVKEKTGRTAQEKAVFIKEGVFLIKPEHTNEQLQKVAQEFAQKFKVKLIELHVHRDEGHWDDKKSKTDWKSNLHAHIVIENINRNTGKSIGWQRNEMILIQDFFSERLEMERGKKSTKTHIDSLTFKSQKIEEEEEKQRAVLRALYEKEETIINRIDALIQNEKKGIMEQVKTIKKLTELNEKDTENIKNRFRR
jgi:hypothetical protein